MNTRNTFIIKILFTLGLCFLSGVSLAAKSIEPNQKTMKTALEKYLAQQGNFCLGKFEWPIDVSEAEFNTKTKDALQMPVLEKLGLVVAGSAGAMRKVGDSELVVPVKRYTLTDAGKEFYLPKQVVTTSGGNKIVRTHDFCAGKLTLDKVVSWSKPEMQGDSQITTVAYTYKMAPAKWAKDPDIQKVFPMLAQIVNSEGALQLKQMFRLSGKSWEPVHPWDY